MLNCVEWLHVSNVLSLDGYFCIVTMLKVDTTVLVRRIVCYIQSFVGVSGMYKSLLRPLLSERVV